MPTLQEKEDVATKLGVTLTSGVNDDHPYVRAISESGGAYNSGQRGATDAFVSGFWWHDLMGLAASTGHWYQTATRAVADGRRILRTAHGQAVRSAGRRNQRAVDGPVTLPTSVRPMPRWRRSGLVLVRPLHASSVWLVGLLSSFCAAFLTCPVVLF